MVSTIKAWLSLGLRLIPTIVVAGCSASDDGLPECDEEGFSHPLEWQFTEGDDPISGLAEVVRSAPDSIELTKDGRILEIGFPGVENGSLPPGGTEVILVTEAQDTYFATMSDAATGELWLEVGDGAIRPPDVGHMRLESLDEEPLCGGLGAAGNIIASPAAIAFDTDDGTVVLGHREESTSSIDGHPVRLLVFEAVRFTLPETTRNVAQGMIVRLAL